MVKLHLSPDVAALNPDAGKERGVSKYKNQPVVIDNIRFDSKVEGDRYVELRMLESAGLISDLRPAPGVKKQRFAIGAGRYFVPDFTYREHGALVAVDVKGKTAKITDLASLKMALFREKYPEIELRIERR
jgi:hypothetical protein